MQILSSKIQRIAGKNNPDLAKFERLNFKKTTL